MPVSSLMVAMTRPSQKAGTCTLYLRRSRDVPTVTLVALVRSLAASRLPTWTSVWKPLQCGCLGGWVGFEMFLKQYGTGERSSRHCHLLVCVCRKGALAPPRSRGWGLDPLVDHACVIVGGRNNSTISKSLCCMNMLGATPVANSQIGYGCHAPCPQKSGRVDSHPP